MLDCCSGIPFVIGAASDIFRMRQITGKEQRMQESHNEGLASHVGSESCGYAGNGSPEALTGDHPGRVLRRVSFV